MPGRDGREVGRALVSSFDAERLTKGREHERADDKHGGKPEQEQERLP